MAFLQTVWTPIIIYIIIILLIILYKPTFLYDKHNKKFKDFGSGRGKSLIALPILAIILAIIIYAIFTYIDRFVTLKQLYEEKINKA